MCVGTIINCTPFTKKDGTKVKYHKQLLVAKTTAQDRLKKQIKRRAEEFGDKKNPLRGCYYELSRGTKPNEEATGEDFDYLGKRLTPAQLKKLIPEGSDKSWLDPFDYMKVFSPKSVEDLRKLVGQDDPIGADTADSGKPSSDDDEDDDLLGLGSDDSGDDSGDDDDGDIDSLLDEM